MMNIIKYPTPYQSAFREACFTLGNAEATEGINITILNSLSNEQIGVKRVYGSGNISVNIAPYARGLIDPVPLCAYGTGILTDDRRTAACRINTGGTVSDTVYLTGAAEDPEPGRMLSAAPATVRIRPGEKDEISVIAEDAQIKPTLIFRHDRRQYDLDLPTNSGKGMHTLVLDLDEVTGKFSETTGAEQAELADFSACIKITSPASADIYLERRYEICRHGNGCRLAWLNRYGAIDYYTFPFKTATEVSARKERIYTADGCRTVATSAGLSRELLSEPETEETLEWLAEIISSPRVWTVSRNTAEQVDIADGSVRMGPGSPGMLKIVVRPVRQIVSRKF